MDVGESSLGPRMVPLVPRPLPRFAGFARGRELGRSTGSRRTWPAPKPRAVHGAGRNAPWEEGISQCRWKLQLTAWRKDGKMPHIQRSATLECMSTAVEFTLVMTTPEHSGSAPTETLLAQLICFL